MTDQPRAEQILPPAPPRPDVLLAGPNAVPVVALTAYDALVGQLQQADQRAELLRRQVAELEAVRDHLLRAGEAAIRHRDAALARRDEANRIASEHADEVARLRGLLVEVLPYADAGADALDHWEPYGHANGDEYNRIQEGADAMLQRLPEIRREVGLT